MKKLTKQHWLKMIFITIMWLILWEVADRVIDNRIILSGPLHILSSLAEQVAKPDFWMICAASFLRITLGFLLSFALGFALAVLCYRMPLLKDIIAPVMAMLKIVP